MRKRIVILLLLVFCMAVLTGCGGCKHEWTEADCLTAKTCTLCQETEGEPLGHDWQAADCENPETCTRCALTQGEALGHCFGVWEMAETEMKHTCAVCGNVEAVEPDYNEYLRQEIQGHWDTSFVRLNGQNITGNHVSSEVLLYYVDVVEDSLSFYNMEETLDCTWVYESHSTVEAGVQYWMLASRDGEPVTSVSFLDIGENEDLLLIPMGNENFIMLTRNEKAMDVLEGTWVSANEGKGYSLNFCRDGSFTGDLDGQISGTWHLKTVGATYGSSVSATINLCYERDGESIVDSGSIYFGNAEKDWSTMRENASISLRRNETGLNFRGLEEGQLDLWKNALAEGAGKLVGEWIGTEERNYDYESGENTTTIPDDYTVTFLEDGTFTAQLGGEQITGVWYFNSANVSYGSVYYNYVWKFKETDKDTQSISIYNEGRLTMTLPAGRNTSRSLECMQATEENLTAEEEAKTKPLGRWISTGINVWNSETEKNTRNATTEYSLEVFEDGTFTANLDQQISGRWRFQETYEYEYGKSFSYNCETQNGNVNASMHISNTGELQFNYDENGNYVGIIFKQMDDGEKAALEAEMEKARRLPVGAWISTTYTTWNNAIREGKDEPHSSYTLTVREDGTLTGQLGEPVESTWTLGDIYHGEGYVSYSYSFDHDLDKPWSFSYSDGILYLSYYEDGISHSVSFEKQ